MDEDAEQAKLEDQVHQLMELLIAAEAKSNLLNEQLNLARQSSATESGDLQGKLNQL